MNSNQQADLNRQGIFHLLIVYLVWVGGNVLVVAGVAGIFNNRD